MMLGEDEGTMEPGAFAAASVWARISVIAAGPVFNFILAFVLSLFIIGSIGYDKPVILQVSDGYPAAEAGLKEGDIVSLDAGLIYKGYHSDAARTHAVGQISEEDQFLIDVTKQSFFEGIKYAKAGNHLYDISKAIQNYAEANGFSIVRDLVGHGIGRNLHEEPQVPNFKPIGRGIKLRPGMTLAIEPMVNAGDYDVWVLEDDWTVVTTDSMKSAHYENTILITEGEPEIFSWKEGLA